MLLKLKHWELFLFSWGFSIASVIVLLVHLGWGLTLFPICLILSTIVYFGWIWQLVNRFHSAASGTNLKLFRKVFPIPIAYLILLELWVLYLIGFGGEHVEHIDAETVAVIITPLHLLSLVIIAWGIVFAAKCLKSYETNVRASFNDCAGEFLLIWFSVLGFWYLQPRINVLLEKPIENVSN